MRFILVLAFLFGGFLSVSAAFAGSCGGKDHAHTKQEVAERYFDEMDSNKDKIVDRAEFENSNMANMIKSFDVLQPDENGLVRRDSFVDNFVSAHSNPNSDI